MPIATVDPTTGRTLKTFDALTPAELEDRLSRAEAAARSYRRTSFDQRAQWCRAAADLLDADTDSLAELMTTEMGKTLAASRAEIGKCATGLRYYAEHAPAMLADVPADADAVGASTAFTHYQPLGVVLAVMPWNYPLWQAMRFAAPALMAGNVGLLKHASNVPQTALWLEELFRRAGFPADVFQTLLIGSDQVETVLRDRRVAAATLTGSTPAGKAVAAICGEELKPTVLELGGSDPFVVLADAEVPLAAETAVKARFANTGQSCVCAKRFIVADEVADEFLRHFVDHLALLEIAPMAREDLRDAIVRQVEESVAQGARLVTGGSAIDSPGWYVEPTVLVDVEPGMTAFDEETFGPVATITRARDDDHAVELANATTFGLGASVWGTSDHALAVGGRIRSGALFVNAMVASDPRLPFGGIGRSGYGRELSAEGVREFTNVRTVVVA